MSELRPRAWRPHGGLGRWAAALAVACALGLGRSELHSRAQIQTITRTDTGAISGVVVDATTNQPIGGAFVFILPTSHPLVGQAPGQVTDAKGRFVFSHLSSPDQYTLSATKPGYLDARFERPMSAVGETHAFLVLAEGQWLRDLRIAMTRPAAISGTITDDRGAPIVNGLVRVLTEIPIAGHPQLGTGPAVRTDDRGAYRIGGLKAGRYYVHMPSVQSAFPASTSAAALAGVNQQYLDQQALAGRGAGFVDPVVDADALTQFAAGRYPMPPRSADGRIMIYPGTFHPGSTSIAEALAITLAPGEQRAAVDLRVPIVRGVRVSGVVQGPPQSFAGATLRLLPPGAEDLGDGAETATALIGGDGRFTFVNVPAGSYLLETHAVVLQYSTSASAGSTLARVPPRPPGVAASGAGDGGMAVFTGPAGAAYATVHGNNRRGDWARERVNVTAERDVTGVVVTMRKAVTLSGRFVWEGRRSSTPDGSGDISALPARGTASLGMLRSRADPAGPDRFVIEGLLPGEYVLSPSYVLTAMNGVRVKSIVCGTRDVTYRVIDTTDGADIDCTVTFTDRTVVVRGVIGDGRGGSVRDAAVIAFPAEPDQWEPLGFAPARLKAVSAATDGRYSIQTLPAGDYVLIAVPGDQASGWLDSKFLAKAAPLATRVRLAWDDVATQDLTLKVVK